LLFQACNQGIFKLDAVSTRKIADVQHVFIPLNLLLLIENSPLNRGSAD